MGRAETLQKATYHYGNSPEMVYMIYKMHQIRTSGSFKMKISMFGMRCFDARITTIIQSGWKHK